MLGMRRDFTCHMIRLSTKVQGELEADLSRLQDNRDLLELIVTRVDEAADAQPLYQQDEDCQGSWANNGKLVHWLKKCNTDLTRRVVYGSVRKSVRSQKGIVHDENFGRFF